MRTSQSLPIRLSVVLSPICLSVLFVVLTSASAQAQSGNVVISSNTTWTPGSYQLTSLTVQSGATLTIGGGSTIEAGALLVTGNSTIVVQTSNNTGMINVPGGTQWQDTSSFLNVGTMEVDAGSSISADMQGYVATVGPGAGTAGSTNGGSHCGVGGGQATSTVNCAPDSAVYLTGLAGGAFDGGTAAGSGGASAGGTAGAGGGGLKLYAQTLTLNGTVTSNGGAASGAAGGGSGGGIFILVNGAITGSGSISANGGTALGNGSGGGGGSVTVVCLTLPAAMLNSITTTGGTASGSGIAGGSGYVAFEGYNEAVVINSNTTWGSGIYQMASLTVQGGSTLTIGGGSVVEPGALLVTGNSTLVVQNINTTGPINVPGGTQWQGTDSFFNVGTMEVDAGSSVSADMQGYVATVGPGAGTAGTTNGGSCAGAGGGQAPSTAGNCSLGSGGGSAGGTAGAGGGAIELFAQTLMLNGTLTSNGGAASGAAGGGSGGGIFISVNGAITGSGSISANGGNAPGNGSGGGGGAVTVTCNSIPAAMLNGITTTGGTASGSGIAGGSGVVNFLGYLDGAPPGPVYLNKDTTFPSGSNITFPALTIGNGATLTIGGGSTLTVTGALVVTGNSKIVLQGVNTTAQINGTWQGSGVAVNAGSVQVDAGSSINADGQGYVSSAGPGGAPSGSSAGGSYGGAGGWGTTNANGGVSAAAIYGSATAPTDLGSGGGLRCCGTTPGAGGGAIRLIVTGTLTNNGVISANGGNVVGLQAGGGSGGSVYVTTSGVAGSGVFTANGGTGGEAAGGGGRVAIYYNGTSSTFTGFATTMTSGGACGGCVISGISNGSTGTVAFFDTSVTNSNLSVYQNLAIPAGTIASYNAITVQAGAVLTIGGGSTVTVANALTVSGTVVAQSVNNSVQVNGTWKGTGVTINAGSIQVNAAASINADGQGYVSSAGPGGAPSGSSAGGSYGGAGGWGTTNANGGVSAAAIYGSATAPTDLGSGGGLRCCGTIPGAGGGAIRLIVTGTLTNNGVISANGGNVVGLQAGGGSGGSVYVTTSGLAGSGVFTANGGAGGEAGGGGGRVAIYYNGPSSTYTGFATTTTSGGACVNGGCVVSGASNGTTGTAAFFDTSVTNSNLSVYQNLAIPAGTIASYNAITVQAGAVLTIGGGSTVTVANALTVSGTIVAQSGNNSAQVNGTWQGTGVGIIAGSMQVNAAGSINADGQGYVAGAGPGAVGGGSSDGGSYGGLGGVGTTTNGPNISAAAIYGSATAPTDLGSGGSLRCCGTTPGAGGGALTLTVTGTLTNNGVISSNGGKVVGLQGGGGSGGTVSIRTGALAGSGSIAANGGAGGEGGGSGGRVAIFYTTNSGFNLTLVTANGSSSATGNSGSAGAAGTVYTLGAGSVLTVSDNTALPANANLSYASVTVNNQGTLTLGSGTTITANNITVSAGGTFSVGGGSTVTVSGAVVVIGNSSIVLQSTNNTAQVGGIWLGAGVTMNAASVQVDPGSSINADGQGYVAGVGPGGGPAGSSDGGSYGGLGGVGTRNDGSTIAAGAIYGSPSAPTDIGSGGGLRCCGTIPGAGGGAMRLIVTGTLTNNGIISANGGNVIGLQAGGGSGGSVFILTNTLTGSGSISANGGAGGEASGGGGRVAVYYLTNSGFNPSLIVAGAGLNGHVGSAGTVTFSNTPLYLWVAPASSVLYGTENLVWMAGAVDLTKTTVNILASGPQIETIGTGINANSSLNWDTTTVPDGRYELRLVFYDATGKDIKEVPRTVVVNNSVAWHSGTITSNQEWTANQIQGLNGNVIIPSGVTVTIDPGTIVKALPGAQIIVQSGGTLNALGASSNPVIFTAFDDSSVGGDSDFSAGLSVATPGEWNGISAQAGGQFNNNSNTEILYVEATQSGTLPASESWPGDQLFLVTGIVTVPSGSTLTIQPGAVVKFGPNAGITVQPGGQLIALGTVAQPIYFTSINDDTIGSVAAGSTSAPMPGDWGSIAINGGIASFNNVQMFYGGGPQNTTNLIGMIETGGNAVVTISNSVLGQAFWNGILTGYVNGSATGGDTVTVTNTVVHGVEDRGINAWPGSTVNVVNDTFDGNSAGIMSHGGTVTVANTIVSNSLGSTWGGVYVCCGGTLTSSYTDVWTTAAGVSNYGGIADPTGSNGNISANPVYVNKAAGNYRLNYGSPAIDAANGKVANYPLTDAMGDPRYSDPLVTGKTGVADVNGNYPDMGAFEFVQTAASNINLTVPSVTGPATAVSGSQATLTWTDTNTGSGTALGPWHDAIYLVQDADTNPVPVLAGEVLVASGTTLGPGESYTATGTVRVPGSTVGNHRWEVIANDRGEVFVGQNSANNKGISLDTVAVDLPQVLVDSPAMNNSFSATGQSWWYKIAPGANKSVSVNLNLSGSTGTTSPGTVQLFVGEGYVPNPQHFDFQQVEWNSPTASIVIPNTSNQTYYVTAYAQALASVPAAFSISASTVQFSLTSVQPASISNFGSQILTFQGGDFTSGATYQLVGANNTVYNASSVFITDSTHAQVTFTMAGIQGGAYVPTGVPNGTYTAQVVEGGSTASLSNSVTVTTIPLNQAGGFFGTYQVNVQAPQEFRSGFPAEVTLNYQNITGYDQQAPVIWITATGANLSELPPSCAGCNTNFPAMYEGVSTSGLVLGISKQGPAGVLPAGAQGSIKFLATPNSGNSVTFTTQVIDPAIPDTLIGYTDVINLSSTTNPRQSTIVNLGLFPDAVALCNAYLPPGANAAGFSRTCMQFLVNVGYGYGSCGALDQPTANCGALDGSAVNNLLAADTTALSKTGIYEYDTNRLMSFELQNDGLDIFNKRYHQGAFGYGQSHAFDITATVSGFGWVVNYPDGSSRTFGLPSSTQANQYLGIPGDYGVWTVNADATWTLTESSGIVYHFKPGAGPLNQVLDYIQDLNGNRITLTYTNGLVTSAVDSVGNTISFVYDALGHVTQSTDPVGRVTTYTYDIKNDTLHSTFLTSISDPNGTTSFAWNEGGPSGVGYLGDGCVITYCEPAIGVNTITHPDGTHIYFNYDTLGRISGEYRDGPSEALTYTYGPAGAMSVADVYGNMSQLVPNQYGALAQYIDPLGSVTQLAYDPEQKVTGMQGPMGTSTSIGYDTQGNVALLLDPLGNQQNLSSTANNKLQSITDGLGNATSFAYDSHYNLTGITASDNSTAQSTYDSLGNVKSWTNRRGHTINFTYDAKNQLQTKTYANGPPVSYTYDAHGGLASVTASNGLTQFTRDSADRLTGILYPNGKSIQYFYNAGGQRTSMSDSTGFTVQYAYDPAGRLLQMTNGNNALIVSYTYDLAGRLTTKTRGNGTYTTYTYDANENPLHLINYSTGGSVLSEFDYTYDALGRRVTMNAPSGAWAYGYDSDSEIANVTLPGSSVGYTYDADGNRLAGSNISYDVNNLDQYTSAGGSEYKYDADGNLISGGGWTYSYDDENHLIGMVSPTDSWSYQYDGLGARISATHNGVVTQYLNDPSGLGNVVAEFTAAGQLVSHYTYGLDLTSAVPASGSPAYYHFDATGNTTQMTDASGNVVNSYTYLPFGEKLSGTAGVSNPFTYVGEYGVMDEGSGLYFMRNRWYSPALGRFVQQDPTGFNGGPNLYAYTGNGPTNDGDPEGTDPPIGTQGNTNAQIDAIQQAKDALNQDFGTQSAAQTNQQIQTTTQGAKAEALKTAMKLAFPELPELEVVHNPVTNALINHALNTGVEKAGHAALGEALDAEAPENNDGEKNGNSEAKGPEKPGPGPNPKPGPAPAAPSKSYLLPCLQDMANFFSGGLLFNKQPPNTTTVPTGKSIDPNGKLTSGFGNQGFVPSRTPILYTIYFENQPTASAPAEEVAVSDPLPSNLDWSTVQLSQIEFNNVTINIPAGLQTYAGQVNVSTDPNPVSVSAALNADTGVLSWTMQSVDRTTGGLPANPLSGFLPPNNSSNLGTGYVTFTVMPKLGQANGTIISNQGSIVFDVNASISTNKVTNTIDSVYPVSSVNVLPSTTTSASFPVSWSGTDSGGAGIADYDIYVSTNGGAYSLWLPATELTAGTYPGAVGQTYSFYSMAIDNVGLRQQTQGAVQTITVIQASTKTTPTLTVSPALFSIITTQSLSVTVAVSGGSGNPVATGSVTLTSGTYASTAQALAGGSATIVIPAGSLALGGNTLTASYAPDSNSSSTYNTASGTSLSVSVAKTTPTVVVSPSLTSIKTTQALSVTVTVSGGVGSPTATGSVTLTSGSYSSAATTLSSGSATINIPEGSLALGSDTLTASYTPDSGSSSVYNTASGASAAVSVAKTTPTVTVTPSSFSITSTQQLAVTVAVNGGTGTATPTGSVTLTSGSYTSAGTTLASGSAIINIPAGSLASGGDTLAVTYTPDSSSSSTYNTASGTSSTVTVTKATPTVAVTPSLSSITAAQALSVTIAVSSTPTPTGTVTLSSGSYASAATALTSGSATINIPAGSLAVGGDTLTARYSGDSNYSSASGTSPITVTPLAPAITFTVPNHTYGDAPFTATATSNSSGAITYSVVSGPATISGSTVTLTGAGTVTVQASQAAAGNYTAGTQNATFTVASESQSITFAGPASPVNYGVAPITLSASSTSGLTVTFSVLSGPASISGSALSITGVGTVVVAADQSGNANFTAATEVTRSVTVSKGTPAAGLTASPNPALVQNAVTLTATIASAVGTPTGSVVFSDSGTALGTANLNSGIATLSLSTLGVGTHSITAVYGGDGNFNSASSAAVSETVQDFTLTIGGSGSSQTVQPGGTATYSLPMTPSGGTTFPAAVTFSATGLPTGFTATFSPPSLAAGSSATNVALMIQVPLTARLENRSQPGRNLPLVAFGMLVLPLLGGLRHSRKGLRRLALIAILLAGAGGAAMLTGCGGGGGGGSQPQTYNITVTATSGALSHSTTITLTVQ